MTDSITDKDLDRIFGRIQAEVDMDKVKTKTDMFNQVRANPNTRNWSRKLNDFIWEQKVKIPEEEEEINESFTIGIAFAKEKGIILSEKTIAKIYDRWGSVVGKRAIVIRTNGRIRTWRYL